MPWGDPVLAHLQLPCSRLRDAAWLQEGTLGPTTFTPEEEFAEDEPGCIALKKLRDIGLDLPMSTLTFIALPPFPLNSDVSSFQQKPSSSRH